MGDALRLRIGRHFLPLPAPLWHRLIDRLARRIRNADRGLTGAHRAVQHFAVREIPRSGEPLTPEAIAAGTAIPITEVVAILRELERKMRFLWRDPQGRVTWAYPVTAEATPHHMEFSTGERLDAAWAADAVATPFVQGRLRDETLSVAIRTECACCRRSMDLEIDSDLRSRVLSDGASPLLTVPMIDVRRLKAPNIIDDFWRESLFFWSEEHARKHRPGARALYPTIEQAAFLNRHLQSALFGLEE